MKDFEKNSKKTFIRKSTPFLYKWSPETGIKKDSNIIKSGNPTDCNAPAFSQGEDWITTYCYKFTTEGLKQHHFAYVECDYVK